MSIIQRITRVELENFKGFRKKKSFDTDADIVLLIGPNGYGKTSFMEAMTLVLTGHVAENPSFSRTGMGFRPVGLDSFELTRIQVTAQLDKEKKQNPKFGLCWDGQNRFFNCFDEKADKKETTEPFQTASDGIADFPRFLDTRIRGDIKELHARICVFYQETLLRQFDETATGKTIRDVLEPLPPAIKTLKKELKESMDKMDEKITGFESFSSGKTDQQVAEDLEKKSGKFLAAYNRFAGENESWPKMPAFFSWGTSAFKFFNDSLSKQGRGPFQGIHEMIQALEKYLKDDISNWLNRLEKTAVRVSKEGRELEKELAKTENKIKNILAGYPRLDQDLQLFNTGDPDACDPLTLFHTLAAHAERWAKIEMPDTANDTSHKNAGRFRDIRAEFARVDRDAALRCHDILANWLTPRQQAKETLETLERQKRKIQDALKQYRVSEAVERAEKIQRDINLILPDFMASWKTAFRHEDEKKRQAQRQKAADLLKQHREILQKMDTQIKKISHISTGLHRKLRDLFQGVARRFSFVEGMLPLDLVEEQKGDDDNDGSKILAIVSKDGRKLEHFSTGQKAQTGISFMAAQNLMLSRYLSHRIILLDDVTTSYDLSNLTREAILWRQIAYGYKTGDELKRQIFISTHHEDLTNNLVALLAPPYGSRLRLIRFAGWRKDEGPELETYEVQPGADADDALKARLAQDLAKMS